MNKDEIIQISRHWLSCEQEGFDLTSNQEFNSWISISTSHKEIFEEEKRFRESIKKLSTTYKENARKKAEAELKREKFISRNIKIILPLAACILLLFSISFFNYKDNTYTNNIYSKNEIIQNILLPDKSKITIDARTDIEITYTSKKREVYLKKGKAVFEVSSNKNRAFYVKSNSILIQVVGTKFEVYKQKDKVNISVLEGIVNIRHGLNKNSRIVARLEKGDILDISNTGNINTLENKPLEEIALWRDEKLIFKQTPLKQVIKEFSKYIEYKVKLELDKKDDYLITGDFKVYEFNKFLKLLPLIYPIKVEKENKKDKNQITLRNDSL